MKKRLFEIKKSVKRFIKIALRRDHKIMLGKTTSPVQPKNKFISFHDE